MRDPVSGNFRRDVSGRLAGMIKNPSLFSRDTAFLLQNVLKNPVFAL
jgi:hypothetical protein